MRDKLIKHIEHLFAQAPDDPAVADLKHEILMNTLDRYDEEVAGGHTEDQAFETALAGIGDINELLEPYLPKKKKYSVLSMATAIALYVCCVIPPIIGGTIGGFGDQLGAALMFVVAGVATYFLLTSIVIGRMGKHQPKFALGIALYVVCVVPPILFSAWNSQAAAAIGASLMFVIAALATGLLLYALLNSPKTKQPAEPKEEPQPKSRFWSILLPIYWVFVALLFIFVCPTPLGVMIFPFAASLISVFRGMLLIPQNQRKGWKQVCGSVLWLAMLSLYIVLTLRTGAWHATWLIFPMGAALNGIVSGIVDLILKEETK